MVYFMESPFDMETYLDRLDDLFHGKCEVSQHSKIIVKMDGFYFVCFPTWMVYFMGNPNIEMDDDWGYYFRKQPPSKWPFIGFSSGDTWMN